MVYELGDVLTETDLETAVTEGKSCAVLVSGREYQDVLNRIGILFEGELNLSRISFCKMETQQEYLYGTLAIPRFLDISGSRYRMCLFITDQFVIIVDDSGFASRVVENIRMRKIHQGVNKGRFLFNFISEFLERDYEILDGMERTLMNMEEEASRRDTENYHEKLMPLRRELLILRSYYNEMVDFSKNLEDNENGYFTKKQIPYFATIEDRAERLMNRTAQLLEYAGQVRDAYQSRLDARQNRSMQFLTIISTIFLPLTLITSWYGMNFKDMPELENGYPGVIVLCILVIVICIWIFKIKKML